MADIWIVDASPLIVLAKIGQARLLEKLANQLLIPEAVVTEVLDGPPEDPARILLESEFGNRAAPGAIPRRLLAWALGRGETEAIALALENERTKVVIDDSAARRCAHALNVPVIGTLGVLVRAKQAGHVESVAATLRAMKSAVYR